MTEREKNRVVIFLLALALCGVALVVARPQRSPQLSGATAARRDGPETHDFPRIQAAENGLGEDSEGLSADVLKREGTSEDEDAVHSDWLDSKLSAAASAGSENVEPAKFRDSSSTADSASASHQLAPDSPSSSSESSRDSAVDVSPSASSGEEASLWTPISAGLAHRELESLGAVFQMIRVDLNHHELVVADARKMAGQLREEGEFGKRDGAEKRSATVAKLAEMSGAVAAINGTFFDENARPLGWLVSQGQELNPFRPISWWAALAVFDEGRRKLARVLTPNQLANLDEKQREVVVFALQVGPRTVSGGEVIRLKRQFAARALACVSRDGRVIFAVSQGAAVESNAVAALMARAEDDKGMGCVDGLMLDGGPSAQMVVETPGFQLRSGAWPVSNAIAVIPREDGVAHMESTGAEL